MKRSHSAKKQPLQRTTFALSRVLFCLLAGASVIFMPRVTCAQTFTNPASIMIPNPAYALGAASTYPSAIAMSGVGSQLTSISVTLFGFSHLYPADVDILLVSPGGQNVMLMSDVGSFFPVTNLTFTFNNAAITSMSTTMQLASGTFAPTNFDPVGNVDGFPPPAPPIGPYGSSFAPFLGTNPNGTWNLFIVDDEPGNDGQLIGGWSISVTATGAAPLQLANVVSRKTHGTAGDFDVALPLGGDPAVECRSSGGSHTFVFSFNNDVVSGIANVTGGIGSVSGSPSFAANEMTVNLAGVEDVQTLTVTLTNVMDTFSQVLPSVTVNARFLIGDVSGNGVVNASDISQVKSQSGNFATATSFRADVSVNGSINGSDIALVKAHVGSGTASGKFCDQFR